MLKRLKLTNVGPAPELELEFGERLNVLTGDNGLGKSFILDIAWWALTRRWIKEVNPEVSGSYMARPNGKLDGRIEFDIEGKTRIVKGESSFDRLNQTWTQAQGRPAMPGLVLYSQVDGSFAVWDPARNYWSNGSGDASTERPPAYVFAPKDVWEGLSTNKGRVCAGLISDWAGWQKENGEAYKHLKAVLEALSSSEEEKLEPGELTRISLDDARDIPTLRMPYGMDVPVVHASAGMRRIISLAYLLVWAWEEHIRACDLTGAEKTPQITFLIDEIEAHLHPSWQRRIVKAILSVMEALSENTKVQVIIATHSPLVLASMEPYFDSVQDTWYDFDMESADQKTEVKLTHRAFVRKGDVNSWLVSEAFDLESPRSIESENAIKKASLLLRETNLDMAKIKIHDKELRAVLGELDPFWIRWRTLLEKVGGES